jgi:predicted DNA-binding transcriptional regulator AlpA
MVREDRTPQKKSTEEERPEDRWFTVKELASRFNVTETCVWLWVKAGNLPPPHKLGPQTRRWPPEVIEAFEAERCGEDE